MAGKLYGVGVGPGDPQLMTLKAVKCIEECSIIAIPAENTDTCTAWKIAAEAVPDMVDREVLSVYLPMTKDYSVIEAAYDEGSARIRQKLDEGSNIAFLNLGDPTLYGTYMGIHKRIADMGYEARIIPGVTSVCAVAARLGISLGGRGENIHILPGSYCLDELSRLSGSKIIMKPAGEADYLIKTLADEQRLRGSRVYAVANCGMPDERVYEDINSVEGALGYFTTFIVKEKADGDLCD